MLELEKQRIKNFVNDLSDEEAQLVVRVLPSKLMSDELARRERLKTDQINAINMILSMED